MASAARPVPGSFAEDESHWDAAANRELLVMHCRDCGNPFWPAGPVCPIDFSENVGWIEVSGEGSVSSWVRFHKRYYEDDRVPYIVVQVRLLEGPRMTTSWTGESDPSIGMHVYVSFRKFRGVWLPEFGPAI